MQQKSSTQTLHSHEAGIRIITYVLLCGYSPFRSEDVKELIRETTEAKIEFHEKYWKNISQTGKLCDCATYQTY